MWGLGEYGFRVVITPSFTDIFYANCFKNGLLPLVPDATGIDSEIRAVKAKPVYRMQVNLDPQTVMTQSGGTYSFAIDPYRKNCHLQGLDDIDLTLREILRIRDYEQVRRMQVPWLFAAEIEQSIA